MSFIEYLQGTFFFAFPSEPLLEEKRLKEKYPYPVLVFAERIA